MYCEHVVEQLDDYLDNYLDNQLTPLEEEVITVHLSECATCREQYLQMHMMLQRSKEIPIPMIAADFTARALRSARPTTNYRMIKTGLGAALAATLVLWFGFIIQDTPHSAQTDLKTVILRVEEPKTIQLAFNAQNSVQNVSFKLTLPEGINLQNRPGKSNFSWNGQLNKGRNILKLPLVGRKNITGELIARIEQNGEFREFRIPMHVISRQINNLPFNSEKSTTL
jgi:hypothetical protein